MLESSHPVHGKPPRALFLKCHRYDRMPRTQALQHT